ncbi:MAG: hypothetical protein HYX82_01510 [Chloroflexi bacterium]|nr:hypothetical protein [Chloroflexota bacterium]
MANILLWWIGVEVVGILALPITLAFLKNLPDRGYIFSKPLGLLIVSYLLWLAGTARVLPNTRLSILLLLALLAIASSFILSRQWREFLAFLKKERAMIVASEVLFTLLFVLWAVLRAYDPHIAATEKPMDFAFLNAILRSQYFPPHDPWLSGYTINYYYFGYLVMATLTKLTGVTSSISFNLANPLLLALTATCGFSLVCNLVRKHKGEEKLREAIGVGIAGAILIGIMGNLEGILEFAHARGIGSPGFWQWIGIRGIEGPATGTSWFPNSTWWWWRATRVINTISGSQDLDYTIEEFPFFSFLLGDMHPHVMALPFVLLSLAISLNLFFSLQSFSLASLIRNPLPFLLISLSLGALGFLNSWDFPTYAAIFMALLVIHGLLMPRISFWKVLRERLALGIVLLLIAILIYIPFYLSIEAPRQGIFPVLGVGTRPIHYALFWGILLFIGASLILQQGWHALKTRPFLRAGVFWALALLMFPFVLWATAKLLIGTLEEGIWGGLRDISQRLGLLIPLILLIFLAGYALIRRLKAYAEGLSTDNRSLCFALALLFFGFLITLGTELFYIEDLFGTRMNTVFKFYYQTWVIIAIASAFGLYYLRYAWYELNGWRRTAVGLWWGSAIVLLAGSLLYTFSATYSKAEGFGASPTLDGLAFVKRSNAPEYDAITRLNNEVKGTPVILESTGGEYSPYARVSSRTGLPTVLGWAGHELQWRGTERAFRGRAEDIDLMYSSEDVELTQALMRKYQVRYVFIGDLERSRYGEKPLEKFAGFMDTFFQKDGVTIYRLRE